MSSSSDDDDGSPSGRLCAFMIPAFHARPAARRRGSRADRSDRVMSGLSRDVHLLAQ
jgi:hypothetical protein